MLQLLHVLLPLWLLVLLFQLVLLPVLSDPLLLLLTPSRLVRCPSRPHQP